MTKAYGDGAEVTAVDGVDLTVGAGRFVALIGPSGSGKSTLLHLLGALDLPTRGEVIIDGSATSAMTDNGLAALRNRYIGFVFQSFHLLPALTAWQNVAMPLVLGGQRMASTRERAEELLSRFGLEDRMQHRPSQLSGGEQQRVALARALVTSPRLIIADEPTGNLDTASGSVVLEDLRSCVDVGCSVIMATHDPAGAASADVVVRIADGRITEAERPG